MAEKFPDILKVDVTDGDDVKGFGRLLISLLHEDGKIQMFGTPSARQMKLMAIIEQWLVIVYENVEEIGVEHRAILMDRYDMLYRYACQSVPDMLFINRQKYSVVESLLKGNKKIDVAETLWMIDVALRQSKYFDSAGKAKKLYDTVLSSWVDDFLSTGNFLSVSQNEAVRRALTFMKEDIRPYTDNPETVKKAAANRISLLFDDLTSKDSKTLESMLIYLMFAEGQYVEMDLAKSLMTKILNLLSVMPQVNRFTRQAYANDLKIQTEK